MSILQKDRLIQQIDGIPVFVGSMDELLNLLGEHLHGKHGLLTLFTPNPEQLVQARHFPWFHRILEQGFCIPDGSGLVWALRRSSGQSKQPVRLAGREVFARLLELAYQTNQRVFLLGGTVGAAHAILHRFEQRARLDGKTLSWVAHDGAAHITHETAQEHSDVLSAIHRTAPNYLFVAYGAPWQEKWISDNAPQLERAGVQLAMVIGGAMDYEAGLVPAVHPMVSSLHLEWLQRLIVEPWRWRRQLRGLQFFWWVLRGKLRVNEAYE